MKFSQENGGGRYRVCAYDDDHVTVEWGSVDDQGVARLSTEALTASFLLTPDILSIENLPVSVAELETGHLQQLVELDIEVLLLGYGTSVEFPTPALVAWLSQRGIGLEVMNRAAACRTYNLLMLEDRRVGAMILFG